MRSLPRVCAIVLAAATTVTLAAQVTLPYARMASHMARALRVERGERVILRHDPKTMPELVPAVRKALEAAGAVVDTLEYGPAADFAAPLAQTDIYIWLPAGPGAVTPPDQVELLGKWLDEGRGRQIHFHWGDGTRDADGLPREHSAAYDRVYLDALDADYFGMRTAMARAIERLRSDEIRVTTPAGTNVRFQVGDRPFTTQAGDASKAAMARARVRIDREIELPAGLLRVAPLEETVNGVIVVPAARFGDVRATGIRLEFERGAIVRARAQSGDAALQAFLQSAPGARQFREFCLGFNPDLVVPPGERWLPYYGYGAGVVRLSLGDNSELGGAVRGGGVRWFFFPDADVTVGSTALVERGRLAGPLQRR